MPYEQFVKYIQKNFSGTAHAPKSHPPAAPPAFRGVRQADADLHEMPLLVIVTRNQAVSTVFGSADDLVALILHGLF